ncbi:PREDICTED: putative disease resistance protein RGA3 [Erythranthe guttata]|uniref:putative disease resistance protein RGA3 n=1 Tax=Erythranthe guttata TaxID=4155 RepID=UPI00064E0975|nr:PREDICTED: putative disease resistance protein RGA3 [Erythranthe guttata]|eukprot:XP_012829387.1 PREDICTED: putative disease resistance protein RGA3 [Erythranthe guttata]
MAEGFLEGTDMEIVGNNFLNIFLQNSLLLEVVGRNDYYGYIMYYNMHDLVHDLASSILNSSEQVRYIGLQSSTSGESRAILNEQAISLRSLLSNDKICVCMFSEFKSLHVLILMGNCVEELPSSIGVLIHLRCLDISGIRIKYLPESVTELYHLQTLRACHDLKKLPNTLEHLMSLRHLHVPRIELHPGMGRLISLRTIQYFGVSNENGCGIDELGSLKNLQGELQIYNLEKVCGKEMTKRADLLRKPNIVKLNLEWSIENRKGENGDESVLEGLEPHPNLKGLYIWGFGGRRLPPWCSTMSGLNNLTKITLEDCTDCEQVPTLGHLPNLKNLYLINLENVKSIGSSFYGIDKCSTSGTTITAFPALERLELV